MDKLAAVGLVPPRKAPEENTLGPFVDRYIESRASLKPRSLYMLKYARRALVDFLGPTGTWPT